MTAEESDLVGNHRFELGPVVDVEMVDTGVGAQLSERGTPRRRDRRTGLGDPVGLADAEQPGAVEIGGVAGGVVGGAEQPARGDAVAPAGVLADLERGD